MRLLLVVLILLACFCPQGVTAEVLLGRVVSADRDGRKVTLLLIDPPPQLVTGSRDPDRQPSRAGAPSETTLQVDQDVVLSRIRPGALVRVWGTIDEKTGVFTAEKLAVAGSGGSLSDPTGVRRRLFSRHRGSYAQGKGGRGGR